MTDPILFLSMLLGFGGVYVLISSFHDDDDDGDDDGENIFIISNSLILQDSWFVYENKIPSKSFL